MEGVIVQRIGDSHDAMRSIDSNCRAVDWIWHRNVECPVPVWDPEGSGRGLILASLVWRVPCCNFLGMVPEDLLSSVNQIVEYLGKG